MQNLDVEENDDLVSIIIPAYNYGHFIAKTLDSLLNQTYKHWQAIVVDDGSTDNTRKISESYIKLDNRFQYIYQENKGLSSARNTGLSLAKGKYIQFLDADDLLSARKLELQVEFMKSHPQAQITYSLARYFKDGEPNKLFYDAFLKQKEWMCKKSGCVQELLPYFIEGNILPVNSALLSFDFIKKKDIQFSTDYKSLEDWHFWIKCLFRGAMYLFFDSIEATALIRVHPTSMINDNLTSKLYSIKLYNDILELLKDQLEIDSYESVRRRIQFWLKNQFRLVVFKDSKINWENWRSVTEQIGWYKSSILLLKELNRLRKSK